MLNDTNKSINYRKHKSDIKLEPYLLQVRNRKHRTILTKIRLSDHKLEIEVGRHQKPKIEENTERVYRTGSLA